MDDLPPEDDHLAPTADNVEEIAEGIRVSQAGWAKGAAVAFSNGLGWTPDLVGSGDSGGVLHVHMADRVRPHIIDRMRAAHVDGRAINIALRLGALYDEDLLASVVALEPMVHVVGDDLSAKDPVPLLAALADHGIRVSDGSRIELAQAGLATCKLDAAAHVKGRRLESLLAFLLSQIEDFRVRERDYRTDTEEIDIVVQQGRTQGGRCWMLGEPFILIEAKNWAEVVPQKEVSAFRVKMEGKRGTVRIGLIVGASGFSSDAFDQEMRFASDELTIALIGADELEAWTKTEDDDEFLETLIRRAMLR